VLDILRELARAGTAIALVDHDPRVLRALADRTLTLHDGHLEES